MDGNPLLQFDFLSLWHGQRDTEKALVIWTWEVMQDREPKFDSPMADGISPVSQEVMQKIHGLGKNQAKHMSDFYEFFEKEFKAKGIWKDAKPPTVQSITWLANPDLMSRDAFVGACWELQKAGATSIRVSKVTELLNNGGRKVSNPATIARNLNALDVPLVEILTEGAGRNGLTLRLTTEGMKRGAELHDEYSEKA